jgi:hypothetical protein
MASLRMGNGKGKNASIHTDELDNGEVIQVLDLNPQRASSS